MKTGIVIPTDLAILGNKILHSGDPVKESNFLPGRFDMLVANGYIKEDVKEQTVSKPDFEKDFLGEAKEIPKEEAEVITEEIPKEEESILDNSNFGKSKKKGNK